MPNELEGLLGSIVWIRYKELGCYWPCLAEKFSDDLKEVGFATLTPCGTTFCPCSRYPSTSVQGMRRSRFRRCQRSSTSSTGSL